MIQYDLLKSKIKSKGLLTSDLCKEIGIDTSTFHRKVNSDGIKFTVGELQEIAKTLDLSMQDLQDIFFGEKVAETQQ